MSLQAMSTERKVVKAFATYMGYFGAKYVGNDIQVLCGNIFDHPAVKTLTLFCIMFQATDNVRIALSVTMVLLCFQYVISLAPTCGKYLDKTVAKRVDNHGVIWPSNVDADSMGRKIPTRSTSRY